jgi:hypothetical protein
VRPSSSLAAKRRLPELVEGGAGSVHPSRAPFDARFAWLREALTANLLLLRHVHIDGEIFGAHRLHTPTQWRGVDGV